MLVAASSIWLLTRVSRQDLVQHPAGPVKMVEFLLNAPTPSKALPADGLMWKGVQTALAPGVAAALLNPVNPSIATISIRSRHVSGLRPTRF